MFFFIILYIRIMRILFIGSEYFDSPSLLFYSSFLFFVYMVLWKEPFRSVLDVKNFWVKPGRSSNTVQIEEVPNTCVAQGALKVSSVNSKSSIDSFVDGVDSDATTQQSLEITSKNLEGIPEGIPEGYETIAEMLPVVDLLLTFVVAGYSLYLICK